MLGEVRIRPAVEADGAAIKAMARAARLVPRGLHWPRFLVAEEGDASSGSGRSKSTRAARARWLRGRCSRGTNGAASASNSYTPCSPGSTVRFTSGATRSERAITNGSASAA